MGRSSFFTMIVGAQKPVASEPVVLLLGDAMAPGALKTLVISAALIIPASIPLSHELESE